MSTATSLGDNVCNCSYSVSERLKMQELEIQQQQKKRQQQSIAKSTSASASLGGLSPKYAFDTDVDSRINDLKELEARTNAVIQGRFNAYSASKTRSEQQEQEEITQKCLDLQERIIGSLRI